MKTILLKKGIFTFIFAIESFDIKKEQNYRILYNCELTKLFRIGWTRSSGGRY